MTHPTFHVHRLRGRRFFFLHGRLPRFEQPEFENVLNFLEELQVLDQEDSSKPIMLFFWSHGGDNETKVNIRETLSSLRSPLYTIAGRAMSASASLFLDGAPEHRYVMRSADHVLMLHTSIAIVKFETEENTTLRRNRRLLEGVYIWLLAAKNAFRTFCLSVKWYRAIWAKKAEVDYECAKHLYIRSGQNTGIIDRAGNWRDRKDSEQHIRMIQHILQQEDQWFLPDEAVECGLADHIIDRNELRELIGAC